jgi:hypothetical protein
MKYTVCLLVLRGILDQMIVGASRIIKAIVYALILTGVIGLLVLLFRTGIIPIVDLKIIKHADGIIKLVPEIWM